MSLLTDRDYLIHSLRFNYVREVLPNHSALTANALVHCAPSPSPYLQWFDHSKYPELVSVSPPLELSLQTRNRLNYSSTIAPNSTPRLQPTPRSATKGSLETNLLQRRLANIIIPVIVHNSPAKSTVDSPLRTPLLPFDAPPSPFADGADDERPSTTSSSQIPSSYRPDNSSYRLPNSISQSESLAPTSSIDSSVVGIDSNNDSSLRRSDSVASSDIQSYASKDPVVVESLPKIATIGKVPLALARRERRRVNISGRILLPIVEPEAGPSKRPSTDSLRTNSTRHLSLPPTTTRSQNFLTFPRRIVPSPTVMPNDAKSALSTLLASLSSTSTSSNPFSTLYAALSSKATDALKLSIYFPHSAEPSKKIVLNVKRDLSVEEVIGVGLLSYWEEEREPKLVLGEAKEGEDEEGVRARETTGWNLRIVEDDGEVDEDFPALDRSRAVSAFSFGEFAIVRATPTQIRDNMIKQSKIQRRPSRILAAPSQRIVPISNAIPSKVETTEEAGSFVVPNRMPMLDQELQFQTTEKEARTNASTYHIYTVLRKLALPMGMGRHTRTLLLDGDYLFIASSASDAAPGRANERGSGWLGEKTEKTKSFHASLILEAGLSRRGNQGSFKIIVRSGGRSGGREGGKRDVKRYDFEAKSRSLAQEIVGNINKLISASKLKESQRGAGRL